MLPVLEVFTNLNGLNEGKHLTKPLFAKIKPLAILLIILTSAMVTLSFLPEIKAETNIIFINPLEGNVGATVQLRANITVGNGEYVIRFDGETIASGNASGIDVETTFTVPSASAGSHEVMIIDVNAGENDTAAFTVLTSYSLEVDVPEPPKQLQEGNSTQISVNVTGGESSKTFVANVTVQAPTNTSYTNMLDVNTSDVGNGSPTIIYPDHFPVGASTNFTGKYKVFLNGTLANQTFIIGLTNSAEYHRCQYVDINAEGYEPNENVTISVTFEEKIVPPKQNVTATEGGTIHANWTVPSNASIGIYKVSVTSLSNLTKKEPPDIQSFTVPGLAINITTRSLAKEHVPNVMIRVFENVTSIVNATSDSEGFVSLMIEIGIYACEAYFKDEKVGERGLNITKEESFNFTCNLTNLKIMVTDRSENRIPEVKLHLTSEQAPEDQLLFTDINGSTVFHSLLPNVTYFLNASRYDKQFNTTTIPRLLVNETEIAWFNVTIICPTLTLQINVTDATNQPIIDATVKVQEVMGGLYYEGNTVEGIAWFNCTFGRYTVKVYASGVEINETVTDLFQNENVSIRCKLYGLTVSIKVVDYFGQAIPNTNVTLQRQGLLRSNRTKSNGVATFSDFIGGSVQIAIYLNDQTQPCVETACSVFSSETIEIKIGKYVIIAGILVETSQLTTALIIAATIILIVSIEVYRRKRSKLQKSSD
jgi:mannose/fructose-specific phosphotransferase system component IIA